MESNFKADYSGMNDRDLKKTFKPPVKGKEFLEYWLKFVRSACEHPGFGVWHLKNIEILCCLYIEYDRMTTELDTFYDEHGSYSYWSTGRNGDQLKSHPVVTDRKSILGEIRSYSKLLGIELKTVSLTRNDEPEDPDNEWELNK